MCKGVELPIGSDVKESARGIVRAGGKCVTIREEAETTLIGTMK